MNRILILVFTALLLAACQHGYVLTGEAGTLDGKAELSYQLPDGSDFKEEAPLAGGKFAFKGEVPDVLAARVILTPEGGDPLRASLYIENCRIHLQADPEKVIDYARYGGKQLFDVQVTGGRSNAFFQAVQDAQDAVGQLPEFKELAAAQDELKTMGYTDMAAYDAKTREISEKYRDIMPEYRKKGRQAVFDCIAEFPDAEAAAFLFNTYGSDLSLEEFESGFNHFTEKVQSSFLARNAREELTSRKATQPGAEAPDFTLQDLEGNPVTLSSLRGQYVIVDFWASWCKPCRAGVPGMKELYAKYHDKGLEILGVSDDTNHDAWKKAVEEDQTPWIHVVDEFPVKNKPARVCSLYGVHYIPTYFLLDQEGKIIGKMNHEELETKLAELLDN